MNLDLEKYNIDFESWTNELMDNAEVYNTVDGTAEALSENHYPDIRKEDMRIVFKNIAYAIAISCLKYGLDVKTVREKLSKIRLKFTPKVYYGSDNYGTGGIESTSVRPYIENLGDFKLEYDLNYLIQAAENFKLGQEYQPSIGATVFTTFHEMRHLYRFEQTYNDYYKSSLDAAALFELYKGPNYRIIIYDFVYLPSLGEMDANTEARNLAQYIVDHREEVMFDNLVIETLSESVELTLKEKEDSDYRVSEILALTEKDKHNKPIHKPSSIDQNTKDNLKALIQLYVDGFIHNNQLTPEKIAVLKWLANN